jgi:hypothetical protein
MTQRLGALRRYLNGWAMLLCVGDAETIVRIDRQVDSTSSSDVEDTRQRGWNDERLAANKGAGGESRLPTRLCPPPPRRRITATKHDGKNDNQIAHEKKVNHVRESSHAKGANAIRISSYPFGVLPNPGERLGALHRK